MVKGGSLEGGNEGPPAHWSRIWTSLSRQQGVWKVTGHGVMMKVFIKSTLAAIGNGREKGLKPLT